MNCKSLKSRQYSNIQHCALAFQESAEFYDAVYIARGKDYADEVKQIVSIISHKKHNQALSLLDVACGTGMHLGHLSPYYACCGLDLSSAMLQMAKTKLENMPLYHANMLCFDIKRKFDVITCLFSSISYLANKIELHRAVKCMALHLKSDGLLLIEPGVMPHNLQPPQQDEMQIQFGDITVHRITNAIIRDSRLIITFQYNIKSRGGINSFREEHLLRLFSHREYQAALQNAGLDMEFRDLPQFRHGLIVSQKQTRKNL